MKDMARKGRGTVGDKHWTRRFPERVEKGVRPQLIRRGEESGNAKLTDTQVLEMRAAYVPRRVSYPVLAKRYGISPEQVRNIILRKAWTHI
jgi:predicted DNA binding protein